MKLSYYKKGNIYKICQGENVMIYTSKSMTFLADKHFNEAHAINSLIILSNIY